MIFCLAKGIYALSDTFPQGLGKERALQPGNRAGENAECDVAEADDEEVETFVEQGVFDPDEPDAGGKEGEEEGDGALGGLNRLISMLDGNAAQNISDGEI